MIKFIFPKARELALGICLSNYIYALDSPGKNFIQAFNYLRFSPKEQMFAL